MRAKCLSGTRGVQKGTTDAQANSPFNVIRVCNSNKDLVTTNGKYYDKKYICIQGSKRPKNIITL